MSNLLSIRPEDAVISSGFLDDEDVIIKSVRTIMFDYAGTRINDPSPALEVTYSRGADEDDSSQCYTAGKAKDTAPSADSKGFNNLRSDDRSGLPSNCNAMMWIQSIVNAGFPSDKLGNDFSAFDNTSVHVNQIPAPDRKGLAGTKDKTILIVTKVNTLPWEQTKTAKGKGKASATTTAKGKGKAAAATTTPAATDAGMSEVDDRATELLLTALGLKPEGIKKVELIPLIVGLIPGDDPMRSKIVPRIINDAFLTTQNGWKYAGGVVTFE